MYFCYSFCIFAVKIDVISLILYIMFAREKIVQWSASFVFAFMLIACCGSQQPKSFTNVLTADDSLSIGMGNWVLMKYYSDRLQMAINYPSFLVRQNLPVEEGMQELFLWKDVSVSVLVDSLTGMTRSSGQIMMGMGAELLEVGDDYSIHEGEDEEWEYYSKVIDSDTLRQVTVILRYNPNQADAVDPLKEWVKSFEPKSD